MRFHDEENKMTKQEYLESEDVFFIGYYNCYPVYKYERQADCGCPPIYAFYLDKGDRDDLEEVEGDDLLSIMELYDPWLYRIEKDKFHDSEWIAQKIEFIIQILRVCLKHRINKPYTYREIFIVVMMHKKYTIGEVKYYMAVHKLNTNISDILLEISYKAGIRGVEIDSLYSQLDEEFQQKLKNDLEMVLYSLLLDYYIEYLPDNKIDSYSLRYLSKEIRNCFILGNCFINEIEELLRYSKLPDDASILELFDEETKKLVNLCLEENTLVESNSHCGIIKIERQDKSNFTYQCEIAVSDDEIKKGFGNRLKISNKAAMWYFFEDEIDNVSVVGMNKESAIALVRSDGSIYKIVTCMAGEKMNVNCDDKIKYMLQVPSSWFKTNNVQIGDKIITKKSVNFSIA